ncbi:MAG: hypothetical protein VYC34_11235, partial [Planctomycetota bacterium]|nr:hypothetical protein [Planctomycetota bacterium]
TPRDFALARDVCSYGYFLLAPNRWDVDRQVFVRTLGLEDGPAEATAAQRGGAGGDLDVRFDRGLSRREAAEAKRQLARMLQLEDAGVEEFHRTDPRWKKSGRARIFRSPTFFEDVVKTVTSCNVLWAGTMSMNRRLCEVINPAFPTPGQLARRRPASLRSRCGVGYRDVRLVELGRLFMKGEVEAEWFEDSGRSDEEVRKALLALPGVGPYAANNLLQLLGRYGHLPMDTEAVRHGREALGFEGTDGEVTRRVREHFEPFGRHRFRSYWFELWSRSEAERGPAWEWRVGGGAG